MTDSLRWKLERAEAEAEQLREERDEALLLVTRLQAQRSAVIEALDIGESPYAGCSCCYIGPDRDDER